MYVLITYDVSTTSPGGTKRLRQVAKACLDRGQRVQNSVFECDLDWSQYLALKHQLSTIIDPKVDSLRFYNLGSDNWQRRVEHVGAKSTYDIDGPLIV